MGKWAKGNTLETMEGFLSNSRYLLKERGRRSAGEIEKVQCCDVGDE